MYGETSTVDKYFIFSTGLHVYHTFLFTPHVFVYFNLCFGWLNCCFVLFVCCFCCYCGLVPTWIFSSGLILVCVWIRYSLFLFSFSLCLLQCCTALFRGCEAVWPVYVLVSFFCCYGVGNGFLCVALHRCVAVKKLSSVFDWTQFSSAPVYPASVSVSPHCCPPRLRINAYPWGECDELGFTGADLVYGIHLCKHAWRLIFQSSLFFES